MILTDENRRKPVPVPDVPLQNPRGLDQDRTRNPRNRYGKDSGGGCRNLIPKLRKDKIEPQNVKGRERHSKRASPEFKHRHRIINLLGSDVSPCQYLVNATTVFLRRSVQNWCFPFFFSFKCGTGVQFLALATLSSSTRSCVPQSVMCVQHTTSSENRIFWRYVLGREW